MESPHVPVCSPSTARAPDLRNLATLHEEHTEEEHSATAEEEHSAHSAPDALSTSINKLWSRGWTGQNLGMASSPTQVPCPARICKVEDVYDQSAFIGRGSFGIVKSGYHKLVGKPCVVKNVDIKKAGKDYVRNHVTRDMFTRLLQMSQDWPHANVIKYLDFLMGPDMIYVVMEELVGAELFKYVADHVPMTHQLCQRVMKDILSAVAHLYSVGIVHRDVKVDALRFRDSRRFADLVLFDLGHCCFDGDDEDRPVIGTATYMAPEQFTLRYNSKVDVWASGVILYIMVTGSLPFKQHQIPANETSLRAALSVGELQEALPVERNLLHRLLTIDPKARISASEALKHECFHSDMDVHASTNFSIRREKYVEAEQHAAKSTVFSFSASNASMVSAYMQSPSKSKVFQSNVLFAATDILREEEVAIPGVESFSQDQKLQNLHATQNYSATGQANSTATAQKSNCWLSSTEVMRTEFEENDEIPAQEIRPRGVRFVSQRAATEVLPERDRNNGALASHISDAPELTDGITSGTARGSANWLSSTEVLLDDFEKAQSLQESLTLTGRFDRLESGEGTGSGSWFSSTEVMRDDIEDNQSFQQRHPQDIPAHSASTEVLRAGEENSGSSASRTPDPQGSVIGCGGGTVSGSWFSSTEVMRDGFEDSQCMQKNLPQDIPARSVAFVSEPVSTEVLRERYDSNRTCASASHMLEPPGRVGRVESATVTQQILPPPGLDDWLNAGSTEVLRDNLADAYTSGYPCGVPPSLQVLRPLPFEESRSGGPSPPGPGLPGGRAPNENCYEEGRRAHVPIQRFVFQVSNSKLHSRERALILQIFYVNIAGSRIPFRVHILANKIHHKRHGSSFRTAQGRGQLELKCDTSDLPSDGSMLLGFAFGVAEDESVEVSGSSKVHDFSTTCSTIGRLPPGCDWWDFKSAVNSQTKCFSICVEVWPAKKAC